MSRVEPKDERREERREAEPNPRSAPADRRSKPSKAEGDEDTIAEALKREH